MRALFSNEPGVDFGVPANRAAMQKALDKVGSELGHTYPIVIGGERRETGQWIDSVNPGRPRQVVGRVAKGRAQDADDAVAAALKAYATWRRMPAEGRAGVLFRMGAILRRRRLDLTAWMAYELDKAWDEADGEVAEAIDMVEWYGREALRLDRPVELGHVPDETNDLYYMPIGVGIIIPPWNFPCAILTGMTMAAVAAGNAVVLKPASNTPVIGYKIFEVMEAAGVPAGVVNFLPGSGAEIGDRLIDNPHTRFIAFTGSKAVGTRIFERAARVQPGQRWLKRVTAEMGGKDAIIVDDSADIDDAVEGIVVSAFGFSGQKCSACSRAIITEGVYDRVLAGVVERTRETVKMGGAGLGEANLGAVVDAKQFESILEYIDVGKHEGRLVLGGGRGTGEGYYIEPTIFADVPPTARIACEEIFGPVLSIIKAKDFEEALAIANDSEYGLTGSLYSRDRTHLERARREFDVGNLYFNRKCTGALQGVHPFGGIKLSGTNTKSGGPDYLQNFMETKAVGERL